MNTGVGGHLSKNPDSTDKHLGDSTDESECVCVCECVRRWVRSKHSLLPLFLQAESGLTLDAGDHDRGFLLN